MKKTFLGAIAMALLMGLTACEKPVIEDNPTPVDQDELVDVRFHITHFDQIPFENAAALSRAGSNVGEACTRINLAVFSDDTKVKSINQMSTDDNFGTLDVALQPGTYTVVILAHSGQGNATISSPEEVKFANNKVTDTFYYIETINVSDTENRSIVLQRAVAMFQLCTEDNIPDNVHELTFKYTGGSSTFNAKEGFGSVNSRQTETREVTAEMKGKPGVFDVYTFPHAETGELKITVTATDADGNEILERVFEDVPVKMNQITRYTGEFFTGTAPSENGSFSLTVENQWTEADYKF